MVWKALDELLERVEKLEEEVYLLKPLEQENKEIPEIYITDNGNSFILKEGNEIRKVSISYAAVLEKLKGLQHCLDGIKKTIDNLGITDPDILWRHGKTNLIIMNEDTFSCLSGTKEPPELFKVKTEYLKEEIKRHNFHLILNTNKLLAKKLSRL